MPENVRKGEKYNSWGITVSDGLRRQYTNTTERQKLSKKVVY